MSFCIGVDGGATKTECILLDGSGAIVARHAARGCNPSIVGLDEARQTATQALREVRALYSAARGREPETTLLCMAGSRSFWQEFARGLADFGRVLAFDDSLPVLELAVGAEAGLVLHSGTGSFVAARDRSGKAHYAGGLGWRLGDPGSGYDIGKRALARALLEFQGWAPESGLAAAARNHFGLSESGEIKRALYAESPPNAKISGFAPAVLQLAAQGDAAAGEVAVASAGELLNLACAVAARLFPEASTHPFRAGLSGPLLNHPFVRSALAARAPFPLTAIEEAPIEGVRRMLVNISQPPIRK